ncbi:MAG: hypothetical protein Q4P30_02035 [Eubacteriales bacterium]|nr:hypothetical protein [Eubacteriales bacterium]
MSSPKGRRPVRSGKPARRRAPRKAAKQASILATKGVIKLVIIVLLSIVLIKVTTFTYRTAYNIFSDKPNLTGEKREYTINVEQGMDMERITDILYVNGIVKDKLQFKIQAKLGGLEKSIRTGSHKVNSFMTAEEILRSLSSEGIAVQETNEVKNE